MFNHVVNVGLTPLEYVAFNGLHQCRRPAIAAFLIAYGASFSTIKNPRRGRLYRGMCLLEQELTHVTSDSIILRAIVKTLARLPTLEELGIPILKNPPVRLSAFVKRCHWYQGLASSPRTLQHYCRVVVRNRLGPSRLRSVSSLPLPVPLKDYLLLEYDEYR